uniref:BY PROTMAP: gi/472586129/gb/EMS23657.1/ mitochondrion protein [Rhodosporidium toruloides NP11] gi/647397787/emb/CDR41049.1/ RHTO0S05e11188g1_1 [Rhodosporidium toruloides] n=1 Tax=Rhodotorula toruloides TaxID=5286 RepID=A0A0K3CMV9_RHOTO
MSTRLVFSRANLPSALPRPRARPPSPPLACPQTRLFATSPCTREEKHGSTRKMRPRDRLQFLMENEKDGTVPTGEGEEATVLPAAAEQPVAPTAAAASPAPDTASQAFNAAPSVSSSSSQQPPPPPPPPPSPPAASEGELILPPPMPGLPPLTSHQLPLTRLPFSSQQFVKRLEGAGVKRGVASELMRLTKGLLGREEERAQREILNKQDLENESYLFTAALAELKAGSQVKSRNDGITLRSLTAILQRETDGLDQKLKEDMRRLASDIQLDMNNRKEETGQELQALDKKDLNSKFTMLLGEMRTEAEATRWISTRRAIVAIAVFIVITVGTWSASKQWEKKRPPPSIEELGVKVPAGEEDEALHTDAAAGGSQRGWSFWGLVGPTEGKRVGADEDEA